MQWRVEVTALLEEKGLSAIKVCLERECPVLSLWSTVQDLTRDATNRLIAGKWQGQDVSLRLMVRLVQMDVLDFSGA